MFPVVVSLLVPLGLSSTSIRKPLLFIRFIILFRSLSVRTLVEVRVIVVGSLDTGM